jgi:hypothetical protein
MTGMLVVASPHHASAQATLVTGRLTPPPASAAVTVYLWPEMLSRQTKPTGTISLPVIGQTTAVAGSFAVAMPLDIAAIQQESLHPGAVPNFMVVARTADNQTGTWFFTRGVNAAAPNLTIPMSPGQPPEAGGQPPASPNDRLPVVCLETSCYTTPSAAPCYAELIERGPFPDTIGELHVPSSSWATYDYSLAAHSEIEVGVSGDGKAWSANGAITSYKDTSVTTEWLPTGPFANQLQTQFQFEKWKVTGYCPPQWTIKSGGFEGGASVGVGVGQWDGYCDTTYSLHRWVYSQNTALIKKAGKGFKYAVGATAFGVNLGSTSDWSTEHAFRIDFGAQRVMCGNDGPAESASLVYKQES